MKVLVVGGAGYIGSHMTVELFDNNDDVVIIDNFSNSSPDVLNKLEKICNHSFAFYEGDACNKDFLREVFSKEHIDSVIHFAGYKAVGESVDYPLKYYDNNLMSIISLLTVMEEFGVYKFVFSSSATVYGKPHKLPIQEDFPLSATNPYGYTKLMAEQILKDVSISNDKWHIAILRYFNPIGAHKSGLIGENPNGIPNNIMPYIMKVATKELDKVHIFGNDYDTKDGTGVRDYIHIIDLVKGHLKALDYINSNSGIDYFNLGTGNGYSVLELIKATEKVNNVKISYVIEERRKGDIPTCYADPSYTKKKLNWQAENGIEDMCRDAHRFVIKNK